MLGLENVIAEEEIPLFFPDAEKCEALGVLGLKNPELDPQFQEWKFRIRAVGNNVKDLFGHAV